MLVGEFGSLHSLSKPHRTYPTHIYFPSIHQPPSRVRHQIFTSSEDQTFKSVVKSTGGPTAKSAPKLKPNDNCALANSALLVGCHACFVVCVAVLVQSKTMQMNMLVHTLSTKQCHARYIYYMCTPWNFHMCLFLLLGEQAHILGVSLRNTVSLQKRRLKVIANMSAKSAGKVAFRLMKVAFGWGRLAFSTLWVSPKTQIAQRGTKAPPAAKGSFAENAEIQHLRKIQVCTDLRHRSSCCFICLGRCICI